MKLAWSVKRSYYFLKGKSPNFAEKMKNADVIANILIASNLLGEFF